MDTDKLFYSLVAMLAVDDEISPSELQFLHTIRQHLNISNSIIISALNDVKKGKRRVHLPKTKIEQNVLLEFLIQAAYADGNLSSQEDSMLRVVADKIGVSTTELEAKIGKNHEHGHSSVGYPAGKQIAEVPAYENGKSHKTVLQSSVSEEQQNPQIPRQCPKCGYKASSLDDPLFTGDQGNGECPACGIILRRYQPTNQTDEGLQQRDLHSRVQMQKTPKQRFTLGRIARISFGLVFFSAFWILPISSLLPPIILWMNVKNGVQVHANLNHVKLFVWSGRRGSTYEWDVEYSYKYKGKQYTGTHVTTGFFSIPQARAFHKQLKEALSSRQPVFCYVNPTTPSIAILDNRLSGTFFDFFMPIIIALVLMSAALAMVIYGLYHEMQK